MTTPAGAATAAGGQAATASSQESTSTTQQTSAPSGTGNEWGELNDFFASEGLTPAQVRERLSASRKWEGRAKENYEAAQKASQYEQQLSVMKKALGLEADEELPAHVQQKLTEAQEAREAAESRMTELTYESFVTRAAAKAGLDAEALLDSGKFRRAVFDELGDEGFEDEDLSKAVNRAIKELGKESRFSGGGKTVSRSGGEFGGSPGGTKPITEAELAQMTPEQIVKAQAEGRLNHLM